jgi:hypothetical protein
VNIRLSETEDSTRVAFPLEDRKIDGDYGPVWHSLFSASSQI